MPDHVIRLPILSRRIHGQEVFEIEPTLIVKTVAGANVCLPFLFDTGTHFTTIPISMANDLGIRYATHDPVGIRGATGVAKGYMAPVWFSFSSLPQLQFESFCCFSTYELTRPLLSLTDVIRHFAMQTLLPSKIYPFGSLALKLGKQHRGYRDEPVAHR